MIRTLHGHTFYLSGIHQGSHQGLPVVTKRELDFIQALFLEHPHLDHVAFCNTFFEKKRCAPCYSLFDDFPVSDLDMPSGLGPREIAAYKQAQGIKDMLKANSGRRG